MGANKLQKVVFLGTGGTIAGTATDPADNVGYSAAQVGVGQLLSAIPALKPALGGRELVSEQVAQVDSKDMGFGEWQAILARTQHHLADPDVAGIVITHGTDTLEETAYLLSRALPAELLRHKPVVLTCAMRPASSQSPDGPQNVLDAVAVALTPGARGVLAVCAGTVHDAVHVRKAHTYRLDAFTSGEAGPLGYVEEGRVRSVHPWPHVSVFAPVALDKLMAASWPRVDIVMNYAGVSGAMVRALCADSTNTADPLRGIVVAGTGNGTLQSDLERALKEAQSAGIRVLRCTRCADGAVIAVDASDALPHAGALSPVKARIALILELLA
jgi:L-asparaginase